MRMHDFYNRLIDIDNTVNANSSAWVVGTLLNQLHKDIMRIPPNSITLDEQYVMIDEFWETFDNLNRHYDGRLYGLVE